MRGLFFIFIFLFRNAKAQEPYSVSDEIVRLKLCDLCTCSEIPEFEGSHLVLNVQCSELDRIENLTDLDKIEWPENLNGLKISAAFEGLGLTSLSKLPPNSQVESLRFTSNAIKTYWPDPFADLPNLKKLSFTQNELNQITPDLFTDITNLVELDLSYNKLSSFNPIDFKSLKNLKRLNLQSNQLKKIPIEALQVVPTLEDLDISKNGIYDVVLHRGELDTLKGLKRLNLNGNRVRSVMRDSFPDNNSIELLDLSNNIIEIVEEEAFLSCTNLRELNLGQNNITLTFSLPPTLQIAILKINTLYHWPRFPSNITYIDLSYNRLTEVYDESSVSFDNLEILNIGGNQIKSLEITKELPKLFSLDISYNLLPEVPSTISSANFPNLEELRLDGNPIESIYFKNIISLKTLYMNDLVKLREVGDKAFSNVVGRSLEGESCFGLFLSNCASLREIRDGAFNETSLCMLDLSKNNLTYLSEDLLDWSTVSEGVNLQYNPWHCTCALQWMLDSIIPKTYSDNPRLLTEFRCGSPRAFEGLRLVHWYNWTDRAMCSDAFRREGTLDTYMLEPSTDPTAGPQVSSLTLILSACIIVTLLIAIALMVYLVKTRRRYRVRQAALRRKRQNALDAKENGHKEQISALNKA